MRFPPSYGRRPTATPLDPKTVTKSPTSIVRESSAQPAAGQRVQVDTRFGRVCDVVSNMRAAGARSITSARERREVDVEPDAVTQVDPVDERPGGKARDGREGVPLHRAHPEPAALILAQGADVGRGGGEREGRRLPAPSDRDRHVDEAAADPAAPVISSTPSSSTSRVTATSRSRGGQADRPGRRGPKPRAGGHRHRAGVSASEIGRQLNKGDPEPDPGPKGGRGSGRPAIGSARDPERARSRCVRVPRPVDA